MSAQPQRGVTISFFMKRSSVVAERRRRASGQGAAGAEASRRRGEQRRGAGDERRRAFRRVSRRNADRRRSARRGRQAGPPPTSTLLISSSARRAALMRIARRRDCPRSRPSSRRCLRRAQPSRRGARARSARWHAPAPPRRGVSDAARAPTKVRQRQTHIAPWRAPPCRARRASEKPIVGCAARTASAKGPPPGTRVSRRGKRAQRRDPARRGSANRQRLPPILTTERRASSSGAPRQRSRCVACARGGCARPRRRARRHRAFRPATPTARTRSCSSTLSARRSAMVSTSSICPRREDHFDRVHDHVVGEHRAHVVRPVDARDLDIDIEAHALRVAVFESIGADLHRHARDRARRRDRLVAPCGRKRRASAVGSLAVAGESGRESAPRRPAPAWRGDRRPRTARRESPARLASGPAGAARPAPPASRRGRP